MFKIVWLRDGGRPHDIGANADSTRRNLRFSREWPRRIEREVETKVRQQVTPAQCRAARALIGISQAESARAAVVPRNAVIDFEVSSLKPRPAYLEAIRRTLESAGVEFIDVGDRPGARRRRGASSSV